LFPLHFRQLNETVLLIHGLPPFSSRLFVRSLFDDFSHKGYFADLAIASANQRLFDFSEYFSYQSFSPFLFSLLAKNFYP
jgi:hypothetical protein